MFVFILVWSVVYFCMVYFFCEGDKRFLDLVILVCESIVVKYLVKSLKFCFYGV